MRKYAEKALCELSEFWGCDYEDLRKGMPEILIIRPGASDEYGFEHSCYHESSNRIQLAEIDFKPKKRILGSSTGYMDGPILYTGSYRGELCKMLFHELGHYVRYVHREKVDDSSGEEFFATIGEYIVLDKMGLLEYQRPACQRMFAEYQGLTKTLVWRVTANPKNYWEFFDYAVYEWLKNLDRTERYKILTGSADSMLNPELWEKILYEELLPALEKFPYSVGTNRLKNFSFKVFNAFKKVWNFNI